MKSLKSILNKGKMLLLAGVAATSIGCASMTHYIKPEAGGVIPVSSEQQSYKPSFMGGAAYGVYLRNMGIGLEAGLDYFHSSSDNVQNGISSSIKTNSFLPRIDLTYSPLESFSPYSKVKPYISAGASLLNEFSTIEVPQFGVKDNVRNSTWGLNAGIGATLFDKIDLKAGYTFLPASENVKGMITLSASYRFLIEGR